MKKILLVAVLVAIVWLCVVVSRFAIHIQRRDAALAERPPKVSLPASAAGTQTSSIQAKLTIRYAALADILNAEAPASQDFGGREHFTLDVTNKVEKQVQERVGGDIGKALGKAAKFILKTITVDQIDHISGDIDYHGAVSRSGPFQAVLDGQAVKISVPLNIHGQAGINGDLAKFLKMDKKNFDGAMHAWSDCTLAIRPDWSPQITAHPDFEWDHAYIEIAEKVRISIRHVTEDPLKKQMAKLPEVLMKALDRNAMRRAVEPRWKPYAVRLPLRDAEAYLHLAPRTVALSDVAYTAEGVCFSLALGVDSQVSLGTASPFSATPLPDLTHLADHDGRLRIDVPLLVDYDALAGVTSKLLSQQTFSVPTKAGPAQIKLGSVEIFPTAGGRIALGFHVEIVFSERPALSTAGEVYVLAEPFLDEKQQRLGLRHLAFRRFLDNKLWEIVSTVFEKNISDAIERSATLDLAPRLVEARDALQNAAASQQVRDFGAISLENLQLGLGGVSLTDRAFTVHALGEASLLLTLEKFTLHP